MKTLFLMTSAAFAISALAWYFIWAIFIHATATAYGTGPAGMQMPMPPQERARMELAHAWIRRFRWITLVLFAASAVTFVLYLIEQ